jgi:hypothetical protein
MSSPLLKKRKVENTHQTTPCAICSNPCDEKQKLPDSESWEEFRKTAEKWEEVRGKYSGVHSTISWSTGAEGVFWHKNCKWQMMNKKTLEQATRRFNDTRSSSSIAFECSTSSICEQSISSGASNTRLSTGIIHDKERCIWCRKQWDAKNSGRDSFRTLGQLSTWYKFRASVLHLQDEEMRARLQILVDSTPDPLAAHICYHDSCFKKYMRPAYDPKAYDHLSLNYEEVKQQFFTLVYDKLFEEGEAVSLKSLTSDYERMRLNFGIVSTIKSSHVKDLLIKEFGNKIGFKDRIHQNKSTIVYNPELAGDYVESAVNFSGMKTDDLLREAASRIQESLRAKPFLDFPAKVDDLTDMTMQYSDSDCDLKKFIEFLAGDKNNKDSTKITFLSQALESLITKKKTQLPLMLGTTLHGITGSKELIKFLSDAGICPSYDSLRQQYDAWVYDEMKNHPVCPDEIVFGMPGTAIIDNDDFNDDDLTGGNTSHRTNMMFVQPERFIEKENDRSGTRLEKCPKGALKRMAEKAHEIKPYKKVATRGEPAKFDELDIAAPDTSSIRRKMMMHALARCDNDGNNVSPDEQDVGAFSGFMSSISLPENRSKPYFHSTLPKGPTKDVVCTLMEKAVAAATLKKMPFIQFVGDQPVYALVEEIKAENPDKFTLILPVLGAFHTQAAFMNAIFKRFNGSGIKELLVSAGLIVDGSIEQALKGKHYNRAQRLYKLLYEALARHLVATGRQEGIMIDDEIIELLEAVRDTDVEAEDRLLSMEMLLENPKFYSYIDELFARVEGPDNHMAKFALSLMQMIEVLFLNIDSIRTHNWQGYLASLRLMMPWLLIYDGVNYGRWLPVYWLNMKSLSPDHAKYMPDIFAQSMTNNPYSALPPDMWIECTMNKGSKLKSGWKRLLRSEKGLLVHMKNANNVNAVRNALTNIFSMMKGRTSHKENVKSRLKTDESCVQELMSLFTKWQCDPFDLECQDLRSMQSGILSNEKLTADLESAQEKGEEILKKCFESRLFSDDVSLYKRLTQNNSLTFARMMNNAKQDEKQHTVAMETKAIVSLIELARKENPQLFHDIWNYRITDHSLSVFNTNGTIRKCNKSKLVDMLKFVEINPDSYVAVCDMGLMWRLATPNTDDRNKGDGTVFSWHDYALKMYEIMKNRHTKAETLIMVNDYYGDDVVNVKDGEHSRRANKYFGGESPNVFPVSAGKLPGSSDFNAFFKNKGNKRRLQIFLKEEFTRMAQKDNITVVYCTRGESYDISKSPIEPTPQFANDHIEADTSIFYVVSQLRQLESQSQIVIDSEDMDVVVLSAHVAHIVDGQLAIKRKKGVFDCRQLCSEKMAKIIVRFYIMTGCDSVSSFYGIGKKTVWKRILHSTEAQQLLCDFSDDALVKFTIRFIYNDKKSETLAEMREKRWQRMKKKSLTRVGIDKDTCVLRNKRVRYQSTIFENYANQSSPDCPLLNGGYTRDGDKCVPIRYTKLPLPEKLASSLDLKREPIDEESTNDTSDSVMESEVAECSEETFPTTIVDECAMGSTETDDSCDELGDEADCSSDEDVDSDLDI